MLDKLEESLKEEIELEGGCITSMDEIEELRLLLQSIMNKDLLDSLLSLYKELNKEPRETEMHSWFIRNSNAGINCKFSIQAFRRFKENRIDRLEPLLERALGAIRSIKNGK
jgi:hypothetical protein